DDRRKNSMSSLNFNHAVLDAGTTFVFASWVCIANGLGGFNSHLANPMESEPRSPASRNNLGEFVENSGEILLLELAKEIEKLSVSDAILTRSPTTPVQLDSIYSEISHTHL